MIKLYRLTLPRLRKARIETLASAPLPSLLHFPHTVEAYIKDLTSSYGDSRTWQRNCDMDHSLAGNREQRFPLLKLPREIRSLIYRHVLGHSLPQIVLPRWIRGMQRLHGINYSVATGRFVDLQLASRQLYHESSCTLYETCQFSFNISPSHASFLDACLLLGQPTLGIHDKSYTHKIMNIVLKANWDGCDWAAIRNFSWSDWKDTVPMVCRELLGFSNLRRLTLDWRIPNPCDFLQPTGKQWSSISRYFEELQAERPHILMEVLAWQTIPGSIPLQHREIRTTLETFTKHLTTTHSSLSSQHKIVTLSMVTRHP